MACNQHKSQNISRKQDTTILWGLLIYLYQISIFGTSQLASYSFVYLSTWLFICLSTHISFPPHMCAYIHIIYIYISIPSEFNGISPCSQWENSPFLWSFSIAMTNYQRVKICLYIVHIFACRYARVSGPISSGSQRGRFV